MRGGLYGNLGALLMGAAGRLEDALDYTEKSIEAGKETSIPDASLTAGMLSIRPVQGLAQLSLCLQPARVSMRHTACVATSASHRRHQRTASMLRLRDMQK